MIWAPAISNASHQPHPKLRPLCGERARFLPRTATLFSSVSRVRGRRISGKCLVLDLFVEGLLPPDMEHSRNNPFHVVGETSEHHDMIGPAKSLRIPIYSPLV